MTIGSLTYFLDTRNQIVTDALSIIKVLGEDEAPTPSALAQGVRFLNRVVAGFENQSKHVWKKTECTLFLQPGQVSYTLGANTNSYCTNQFWKTTVSSGALLNATTISVTSTANLHSNDYIGIVLDNGTLFWSTIASIGSNTVTINNAITGTAAQLNNIFNFTTQITKPLQILDIRRYLIGSQQESWFPHISYEDYMRMPNKLVPAASVSQWTFQRNRDNSILYVYPSPSDETFYLNITYSPSFNDFFLSTDTPDFPDEWNEVIILGLALRLSHVYGKNQGSDFDRLKADFQAAKSEALAFDIEDTYMRLKPMRRY